MTSTYRPQTKVDLVRSEAIRSTQSLLADHGLGVTMDQIAERSGVSRRSLFRHFESRDALVGAALDAGFSHYEEALASAARSGGDFDEWLVAVIEHSHRSHLAAGRAIWQLSSTPDDELPTEFREINKRRRALRRRATRQLTKQAWEAGGGSGEPPQAVAQAVAMSMSSFATHSLVVDFGQSIETAATLSAAVIKTVIAVHLTST